MKDKNILFVQIVTALLIVNYHTNTLEIPFLNSIAKGGFIFNIIFVLLSGYLLMSSYIKKPVTFFSFIYRRMRRILPSFYIVLLLTYLLTLVLGKDLIYSSFLKWFTGFGYFFDNHEIYSSTHLWFVSVILLAYILFIPTYLILNKIKIIYPIIVFAALIFSYIFLYEGDSNIYGSISGYNINRFIFHYLVFVIGMLMKLENVLLTDKRYIIGIPLLFVFFYFSKNDNFSILSVIVSMPIAISIISFIAYLVNFVGKNLDFIFKLGGVTYEIYLVHYIVIHTLNDYLHGSIFSYILTFVISIPLAFIIHRFSNKVGLLWSK